MRVYISGHKGLLGSACVRRLGIYHDILTFNGNILDSGNFASWLMAERPDAVIHTAAKVGGVKANRDQPVEFLLQNIKIQNLVIEASALIGVSKLVFIGTSCLYPKDAKIPTKEEYLMTGPFEPSVEAYAIAKLAGYELCKAYSQQHGKLFTTVALSNLYGPGDNYGPSAHVIPALIKRLSDSVKTGEPLQVWGDGTAVRDFLYVDDAADAIGVVLEKWNRPDLINIGSGIGVSLYDLVNILVAIGGGGIKVEWDETQPIGIHKKVMDISKIKGLGWEPAISLLEGLSKTWLDFTNNANLRLK